MEEGKGVGSGADSRRVMDGISSLLCVSDKINIQRRTIYYSKSFFARLEVVAEVVNKKEEKKEDLDYLSMSVLTSDLL